LAYVGVFPAIGFAAWYCGLAPSVCSLALAFATLKYEFISPAHLLAVPSVKQPWHDHVSRCHAAIVVMENAPA